MRYRYVSERVLSPYGPSTDCVVVPAGDAAPSSTPQGNQWLGLAFVAGMFGLFYWGLRKESPEEIEAYNHMRARKQFSHGVAA